MIMGGYSSGAGKEVAKVMRLSNVDSDAVQNVVSYMTKGAFLEKDNYKLVQFLGGVGDRGIKSIDAYLTAKKRPTLSSKLRRMKVTTIKDLAVKGRDLMKLGLKGKQVGDALQYALEFAVRSGRNNKTELTNGIKEKFGINEEVKVESILKYVLSSKEIGVLKKMRDDVVKKNPDMKPIDDKHLHVSLASGPGWKKLRPEYKGASFSDPDFRIDFEPPKRAESGNSVSWYAKVKQQKQFKDYVTDLLQSDPDPKRVFHVSIANKTGKVGDSVATI